MKKSQLYTYCGKEITLKELSTAQVIDVLQEMQDDYEPHLLDVLVNKDIPVSVVLLSSDLSEEQLINSEVSPTELEELYDKVREVNPTLAAMMERLAAAVPQTRS